MKRHLLLQATLALATLVAIGTIVSITNNRACQEIRHGCEGYSIFLFLFPFYGAILFGAAIILGGLARLGGWIAWRVRFKDSERAQAL
jgi:hypothetical protein